eukprot:TRINITY_DN20794_c0_g1_i1.p1 TRINITY_DN20794_c0_g1~~TRINITY_DN20794_c0_g1_i1.p1  ORF type:complete len:119 (+),score=22.72 TRINITY_DN20794_c0_g1_i1:88-444(+)
MELFDDVIAEASERIKVSVELNEKLTLVSIFACQSGRTGDIDRDLPLEADEDWRPIESVIDCIAENYLLSSPADDGTDRYRPTREEMLDIRSRAIKKWNAELIADSVRVARLLSLIHI